MKVWTVIQICRDGDGEEWECLDSIYKNKPTIEQLQQKFANYRMRPGFIEDLCRLGWADSKNWGGYDPWHFRVQEEECI